MRAEGAYERSQKQSGSAENTLYLGLLKRLSSTYSAMTFPSVMNVVDRLSVGVSS